MNPLSAPKTSAALRGGVPLLLTLWAVLGCGLARAAEAPEPAASAPAAALSEPLPAPPAAASASPGTAPPAPSDSMPAMPSAAPVPSPAPAAAVPPSRSRPAAAGGPAWSSLSAAQRNALRPLQREWAEIDAARKQKWLEVAQRFPQLAPQEQARLHTRMAQWVRMSPEERRNARLTFQEAQQLPPQVRQDRWAEYLALSELERQQLAEQAQRHQERPPRPAGRGTIAGSSFAKTNIVPQPLQAVPPPQPVTPAALRAGLGATTLPLRQVPQPPPHLKPGQPKIMATPEHVDPRTLAPRVGPQAVGRTARKPEPRP